MIKGQCEVIKSAERSLVNIAMSAAAKKNVWIHIFICVCNYVLSQEKKESARTRAQCKRKIEGKREPNEHGRAPLRPPFYSNRQPSLYCSRQQKVHHRDGRWSVKLTYHWICLWPAHRTSLCCCKNGWFSSRHTRFNSTDKCFFIYLVYNFVPALVLLLCISPRQLNPRHEKRLVSTVVYRNALLLASAHRQDVTWLVIEQVGDDTWTDIIKM